MLSQGSSTNIDADDSAVWQRIRQGDEEAWRNVAAAFRRRLRRVASLILPAEVLDRVDASDIVQQTFLDADQSCDTFMGRSLPELYAWMVAILKHNVSDAIREHLVAQRRTVYLETRLDESNSMGHPPVEVCTADHSSPSMRSMRQENEERLLETINALPLRQRSAVHLRYFEGKSLTEIAEQLSCNESAAAAVLARGLRVLRRELRTCD